MKPYNRPNGARCPWSEDDRVCGRKSVGNSKYCATHRSAARTRAKRVWAERFAESEARKRENEDTLTAAELAGEKAQAAHPAGGPAALLWFPSGVTSFAHYVKKEAGFEKAKTMGRGVEKRFPSLAYAMGFKTSLEDAGQDVRVVI